MTLARSRRKLVLVASRPSNGWARGPPILLVGIMWTVKQDRATGAEVRSVDAGRAAEYGTIAEHRDGPIFAHDDNGC